MAESRLIVGLGNPGKNYEYTRHNIGFLVVRNLAEQLNFKFSLSSLTNGVIAEGLVEGKAVYILMPLTYMNESGVALKQFVEKKGLAASDILVVTDDFNLSFAQIRFRSKGSGGGHNGLGSIIYHLGTDEFSRLRIGVGAPRSKSEIVDYVLGEFSKGEHKVLNEVTDQATEGCMVWLNNGINKAMEQFNKRKGHGK